MSEIISFSERKKAKEEAELRQMEIDAFDAVQILTDAQIENIIMAHKPGENDNAARFFFQELFRRDEKHAMEVFRRWRECGEE